ncbi:NAD(P)/FAD-dependent oxidoreductase [Pseudoruegeria sp. SHC-113]|uniref:NAD(P)/FAD-dependent oxidoreductase n=1 Tax=Pseudoruegeria sp. SHC-113 TaxID=2855439 RepID=UPI0021BB81CA|nr:NAD(P)/FAD-dependent oxidoreductase [Pseudoruegeria sp. SHC-113]MCT8158647.1 NAD(P)/FAD-dependent oxidoreductase [Pseudoruegeria sp. SHC-113]
MSETSFDTVILGAGAAGMMCAAHAAAQGGRVLVVDHAKAAGEKIRISGGGRCNFTNMHCGPHAFLSQNPHFAKSALKRYTQWDFIDLVARHGIAYHEKTLGQLFCDDSAKQIIAMLLDEMAKAGASLALQTSAKAITKIESGFRLELEGARAGHVTARNLVIATGGKSIPKMGATGFGYRVAEQFGLPLTETRAGLVPLTFAEDLKAGFAEIAGVACEAEVASGGTAFREALLFTHRGLSGPSILQVSSYWQEGEEIEVNLLPGRDAFAELRAKRQENGRRDAAGVLADLLPKRLAAQQALTLQVSGNIADQSDKSLRVIADHLHHWRLKPIGTEGYRTAEVTLGGVDTDALSAKTMEARHVPGLFFIGEMVDVTGWLGGYNFQWAWSSGWAAGTEIASRA